MKSHPSTLEEKLKRGLKSVSFTSVQILNAADLIREECSKLSPEFRSQLEESARKVINP